MPHTARTAARSRTSAPPSAAPASKRASSTPSKGVTASPPASAATTAAARKTPAPPSVAPKSTSTKAATPAPPATRPVRSDSPPAPQVNRASRTSGPPPMPPTPPQAPLPAQRSAPSQPPPSMRQSSPPRSGPPSIVPVTIPPPPKPILLTVGDKAVHPAHGVGEVVAIEHRELGGTTGEFYALKILENGMKVFVPTNATSSAGLRPVMSSKEADTVLDTMRAREVAVDVQPWSRRFRAYTEMIRSGSPHEVAKVLRDMYRLKFDKDLSFGERRLLDQAKSLLMKEIALAKKMTEVELREYVADIFRA